jgi:hypothetical protein
VILKEVMVKEVKGRRSRRKKKWKEEEVIVKEVKGSDTQRSRRKKKSWSKK